VDVPKPRQPRFVVITSVKPEESEWVASEAERLGVSQSVVIRHAIQRLRDGEPLQLAWDREIVTKRGGVFKAATINAEMAGFIEAECWRLFTSRSDFVRQAILQLRSDGPLWIPRPANRLFWWRGRYSPTSLMRRSRQERREGILRRTVRMLLGKRL